MGRESSHFFSVIKWKLTTKPKPWPKFVENRVFTSPPSAVSDSSLKVTFVGHSTFLLQTSGLNILTDPVWSSRVGPGNVVGPKRMTPPGILWDELPKIDLVIVSHNHYDHLDLSTLKKLSLRDQPVIIVPYGVATPLHAETLRWHESKALDGVTVHLEPAEHWSGRGLRDRGKSLWGAFVIETPAGKIYFAGDTAYGEHFQAALEKHGPFRLAILPIGAYEPRWFMSPSHMNPEEAVLAHKDLGAPPSLAMHFATFRLSDEGYDDPQIDLQKALTKHAVPNNHFSCLAIGESKTLLN